MNEKQQEFVEAVMAGRNVFLTGPAGTGKSEALRQALARLQEAGKKVIVTATVAHAASEIEGTTLNQALGVSPSMSLRDLFVKFCDRTVRRVPQWIRDFRTKWMEADVLVIEEISSCTPQLFVMAHALCTALRQDSSRPFGGIQMVLCGDFCQLGPVLPKLPAELQPVTPLMNSKMDQDQMDPRVEFVMELPLWQHLGLWVIELDQVFRQSKDPRYVELLSRLRFGGSHMIPGDFSLLYRRRRVIQNPELSTSTMTCLYSRREEARQKNLEELEKLPGEEVYYRSYESTTLSTQMALETLKKGLLVEMPELRLRVGTPVILLVNDFFKELGLTNGSRGEVVGFDESTSHRFPIVQFNRGPLMMIGWRTWTNRDGSATVQQIPLTYGWAFSIHKSMGLTMDAVGVNLRRVFAPGMSYVALSRCVTFESLFILDTSNPSLFRAHPKAVHFYRNEYTPPRIHLTHIERKGDEAIDDLLLNWARHVPGDAASLPNYFSLFTPQTSSSASARSKGPAKKIKKKSQKPKRRRPFPGEIEEMKNHRYRQSALFHSH